MYPEDGGGMFLRNVGTVVATNLCVPRPLEIKSKGVRGIGRDSI
jgi:hypothetical protein